MNGRSTAKRILLFLKLNERKRDNFVKEFRNIAESQQNLQKEMQRE